MRRLAGQWVGAVVVSLVAAACSDGGPASNATASTFGAPIGSNPTPTDRVCAPAPNAQCSFADSFDPPVVREMNLAGIDLRGATLGEDVDLRGADLTGSDFTDAVFAVEGGSEPSFTETTCPDFLPSDATLAGRAACRL